MNRGWKKPKTSLPDLDRTYSSILSSSSSPDTTPCIVSFDQALRTALETSGSTEKLTEGFDETQESFINSDTEEDEEVGWLLEKLYRSIIDYDTTEYISKSFRSCGARHIRDNHNSARGRVGFARFPMPHVPEVYWSRVFQVWFSVCGIDGLYYCADCMRPGGEMPIPSRVLRSWDWKPRPVSDRGRAFIEANQDTPAIRIDQHNPTLYDHVPVLRAMKVLREQLQIASMYLFNCRESIADDFRRRVWPRDHLYNDIHAYSISDLILLHNGQLEKQVRGFLKHAVDHVLHCS
ncbi:hypothetical protein OESDEN_17423, partial [Oesophagostomum dentatum]